MTTAFVETTVLTDFLLKRDGSERRAAATFAEFESHAVPQFAWKEFKRGPLKNFVWAHNKLADTRSFLETIAALQRVSRSLQRYLTSTAIQAFHTAFAALFTNLPALQKVYGRTADPDRLHADALRLELRRKINSSWRARKTLFGGPYHILTCYPDAELKEDGRRINLNPRDCPKGLECCLKASLEGRGKDLAAVRSALKAISDRQEVVKRAKVIRQIEKHFTSIMSNDDCRSFGDAYFVLFCPEDAVVISTNLRDIEPMAAALGIEAMSPK